MPPNPILMLQVGGEVAARLMRGERTTLTAVMGGGSAASSGAPGGAGTGPGDFLASLGMAAPSNNSTFGEQQGLLVPGRVWK